MGDGIVKKWKVAPFLDIEASPNADTKKPEWARIKKATAFDLAMNPSTSDFDYIADETPTTELDHYKPTLSQPLTMYKGEKDYEFVFNKFYNLQVGDDAKTNFLLVFFQEPLDTSAAVHKVFKAWMSKTVIAVNDLNSVDSTITFENYLSDIRKGYVTVTDGVPVFTEGTYTEPAA